MTDQKLHDFCISFLFFSFMAICNNKLTDVFKKIITWDVDLNYKSIKNILFLTNQL